MPIRVVINGREINSPAAKAIVAMFAVLLAGLIAAAVIFLILPIVGIAVTLAVGMVGVVLVALGIAIPIILLGGAVLGALLTPFAVLKEKFSGRNRRQLAERNKPNE